MLSLLEVCVMWRAFHESNKMQIQNLKNSSEYEFLFFTPDDTNDWMQPKTDMIISSSALSKHSNYKLDVQKPLEIWE